MGDPSEPKFHGGSPATTMASQVQVSTSNMSLKLCLWLAVVALLATAIPLVGAQITSDCVDTNNNAVNHAGQSCSQLSAIANEMRDDDRLNIADFCADVSRSNSASFTVNEMCCTCGGGSDWIPPLQSNEPTTMPSNEPTAYVQGPISTTCFDLKSSYQNNLCCSQDKGQAATFNGTAVTCGTVLASYTSSECCDADLAKNATMTFPASTLLPTSEPTSGATSTNTPSQTSTGTPSTTPPSTSEPTSEATSTNTPSQTSTDTPSTTPQSTSEPTSEATSTNTPSQTSTGTPSSTPTSGASSTTAATSGASS